MSGTLDNEPDYGTPKGFWRMILSGQVISHTVTYGWEAGMSASLQYSNTLTLEGETSAGFMDFYGATIGGSVATTIGGELSTSMAVSGE